MLTEFLTETKRDWDRSKSVGASEIFGCARKAAYLKQGLPIDKGHQDNWGMKERGHHVEAWAVNRFLANGAAVHETGDDQVTYFDDFLSATPDGYFETTSFDIKSFDPRKGNIPDPMHIMQARTGATLNPKTNQAMLIYINASDYEDQREFGPWDQFSEEELFSLRKRASDIMHMPADHHPREGYIAGDCSRLNCPYRELCIGPKIDGKGDVSDEDRALALKIQERFQRVKERLEAAERDEAFLKEEIRKILRANNTTKITNVASIRRDQRDSLDTKAMERDGINVGSYRIEGKPFDVITIRKPKGANAK